MILLDTDILSLLARGNARVARRAAQSDDFTITIVTRIEVLRGRFDSILTAAQGDELMRAQQWLNEDETYLSELGVVPFDQAAA